jgi:hypothetical protein
MQEKDRILKQIFSTKKTFQSCRQTNAKLKISIETQKQIWHALAASCMQRCQFFAITLPEQLFELQNENVI